jgi:cell division protein FtsB
MLRELYNRIAGYVQNFIDNPKTVLGTCLIALVFSVLLDGSLARLWNLRRDADELSVRITNLKKDTQDLNQQIRLAQDPTQLELRAREKFDLVAEGDLVFIFNEEQKEE